MLYVENNRLDYKSLKILKNGHKELAITCVAFANAQGGEIWIGFEDKSVSPNPAQRIANESINKILKRLQSLCFNVGISASGILKHENDGEYFIIQISPSQKSIAHTSDGKYYIRVGDQSLPLKSEDIIRLAAEKDNFQWELQLRRITISDIPKNSISWFAKEIRDSKRVKSLIKELSDLEISEHYNLIQKNHLTNLGVLWLGDASQRARLSPHISPIYCL